jgi:hypothetical protein
MFLAPFVLLAGLIVGAVAAISAATFYILRAGGEAS